MDEQATYRYEVKHDAEAYRRFQRAYARSQWPTYAAAYLSTGAYFAFCGISVYWIANMAAGIDAWGGLPYAALMSFLFGMTWVYSQAVHQTDERQREYMGLAWTCEIAPEVWRFVGNQCGDIEIPWNIMRVKFEHPDAWLISYGDQEVMVYREPLRAAGLEDLFRSRIGRAGDGQA